MVWEVLYSGQFECVCSVAMWALCVNFGIACGFMWARSCPSLPVKLPAKCYAIMKILGFRSYTPLSWAMKGASSNYMQLS